MNSTILVAATHRRSGKVADGTSTQVVTYMINRWKAKINRKGVYNVRNPPVMGDRKRKKREYGINLHDLGNLCNHALKKE